MGDDNFDKNAQLQREFATQTIGWKVKDAQRAGIHPLYALGAATNPASPIYAGGDQGQTSMGHMGQSMRPPDTLTPEQKQAADLANQKTEIEIAIRKKELELMGQPPPNTTPPPGLFHDPIKYIDKAVRTGVKGAAKHYGHLEQAAKGIRSQAKSKRRKITPKWTFYPKLNKWKKKETD